LGDVDKPVSNPYESTTEINPRFQPLTGGSFGLTAAQMTPWITASFADRWYADALAEAKKDGADSRRREIVFAVACAECYLFEWVRDTVLNRDYRRLNQYFQPRSINGSRTNGRRSQSVWSTRGLSHLRRTTAVQPGPNLTRWWAIGTGYCTPLRADLPPQNNLRKKGPLHRKVRSISWLKDGR